MGFVILIAGLALWAAHSIKIFAPARRQALVEKIGEGPEKGVMTLVAIAAIALMTIGYQQAGWVNVWYPPAFLTHVNNLLMVVAVAIFIAGAFPSAVRRYVRHPQLIGVKTWALAHLLVNGDLASIVLFGGLLGWAVAALIGTNKRDGKPPLPGPGTWTGAGLHAGVALALYVAIAGVHNWLGVWPFAGGGM